MQLRFLFIENIPFENSFGKDFNPLWFEFKNTKPKDCAKLTKGYETFFATDHSRNFPMFYIFDLKKRNHNYYLQQKRIEILMQTLAFKAGFSPRDTL